MGGPRALEVLNFLPNRLKRPGCQNAFMRLESAISDSPHRHVRLRKRKSRRPAVPGPGAEPRSPQTSDRPEEQPPEAQRQLGAQLLPQTDCHSVKETPQGL